MAPPTTPAASTLRVNLLTAAAILAMLAGHYLAALDSLRREGPTIDEVAHLPAGVTYWQTKTFKLYPHNPPLAKLVAALPVVLAGPVTEPLYTQPSWTGDAPSQATFAHSFAYLNAPRYFELFTAARSWMPMFSMLGGLAVFAWSTRLYGRLGGLLSLALWCLCPNILAHARLVTSDVAGSACGVAATFVFWMYLRKRTWAWTIAAGLALGVAELSKFSLLLLYAYWPTLWLARRLIERDLSGGFRRLGVDALQGLAILGLSVVVIDVGYGFEGVGRPLGSYEFASKSLTRPLTKTDAALTRPGSKNELLDRAWAHRINRFRGTILAGLPCPLPSYYLRGFDEQRLETEGIPKDWFDPKAAAGESMGYWVFLDGVLRQTGWWYYYLACLAYKVPEGTWAVVVLSLAALVLMRRSRAAWFDELAVLAFPAIVLFAMTALTDINLGLRYVLPIFPFVYVSAGKVAPWIASMRPRLRWAATGLVAVALAATAAQTALIHPSYLASFNWISGGPNNASEHLIDSNLDWGQDLPTLQRWLVENRPGRRVGLAYFGQINPAIYAMRGEELRWFLPPTVPGMLRPTGSPAAVTSTRLEPGVYAVSASLVRGLPWRLYDVGDPSRRWMPTWSAEARAFAYFARLMPTAKVGRSIFVYDLTEADCAAINLR